MNRRKARAWYHFRAGELAFNAGDVDRAIRDERDALEIFPTDNLALKDIAKFELAVHADRDALRIPPFTETLGYEADAQAALGDAAGAATRDVIFAIKRIGSRGHSRSIRSSTRPSPTMHGASRAVASRPREISLR
jgi:tetratricopeptide (TPR) repeat protein